MSNPSDQGPSMDFLNTLKAKQGSGVSTMAKFFSGQDIPETITQDTNPFAGLAQTPSTQPPAKNDQAFDDIINDILSRPMSIPKVDEPMQTQETKAPAKSQLFTNLHVHLPPSAQQTDDTIRDKNVKESIF